MEQLNLIDRLTQSIDKERKKREEHFEYEKSQLTAKLRRAICEAVLKIEPVQTKRTSLTDAHLSEGGEVQSKALVGIANQLLALTISEAAAVMPVNIQT